MKYRLTVFILIFLSGISSLAQSSQPLDAGTRAAYQRAIEQVYWQHRIWPDQNTSPKPPLDSVISSSQLQDKAEDGLRLSSALATVWHQPITGAQLQAEMVRMARDSKQPEVLGELFAALNNDPQLIAEILARPNLAERLARNFYNQDQRFSSKTQAFGSWWSKTKSSFAPQVTQASFTYVLPSFNLAPAAPDSWSPTHTLPDGDDGMTWVWTGSEMIIWGGGAGAVYTGSRYDPATDSWHSTNNSTAPDGRTLHTAVWTGTEMIVWGGCKGILPEHSCESADGARYNPASDSWTPTSTAGVPHPRLSHTAVWTGREMIVWGGCSFINDACRPSQVGSGGGRYNPSTDSWTPTNTANTPLARDVHTAVWTGSRMIVWGGFSDTAPLSDGGVYNPASDTWTGPKVV